MEDTSGEFGVGGNLELGYFSHRINYIRGVKLDKLLYIKNMVCSRCVMVVNQVFEDNGLHPKAVRLGEVEIGEGVDVEEKLTKIDVELLKLGFERIDDKKSRIIEKIKTLVIEKIHHQDQSEMKYNWSTIFSENLHYDYNYLSTLFSSVEGITLEQYIIQQKIEKVKELLFYDELNMSEIADKMGYSSVQHLSGQFKKVTGATPSEFKKSRKLMGTRKPLDQLVQKEN